MIGVLYIEGYIVDTFPDEGIDLSFNITDLADIESRNTSFSKTIILPHTPNNAKLLGYIFDIAVENDYTNTLPSVQSNFNPLKQAKAVYYSDGVRVFDGVMRLINIKNTFGNITYEVNLFGKLKDILYKLGDKTLQDINWTDYNHTWNITQVQNTWIREKWVDGQQNYVYPLVDYGWGTDTIDYDFKNMKPAVFIREIIKRMFDDAGFIIDTGFFDTEYFKSLVLIKGDTLTKLVQIFLDVAGNNSNYTGIGNTLSVTMLFINQNNGFLPNGTNTIWTSIRPDTYKANVKFKSPFVTLQNPVGNLPDNDAEFVIELVQNATVIATQTITCLPGQTESIFDFEISADVDIAVNDIFTINRIMIVNPNSGIPVAAFFGIQQPQLIISIGIPQDLQIIYNANIEFSQALPKEIKQRDFLKSIILMHNLFVEPDPIQQNKLNFVPYPLYYERDRNLAYDWTEKIDRSQEILITPLSDLTSREYKIKYEDDTDYWSEIYRTKNNISYGEYSYLVDTDFELASSVITIPFGPPVLRDEGGNKKLLHLYKVENLVKKPDNFKPRIAIYKRQQPTELWNLVSVGGSITGLNTYPYAGHLDNPDTPTLDILFGTPKEVYFTIGTYTSNNLGNSFYKEYLDSITDKDSKLLSGSFRLTPLDIKNFEFYQLIKIGNHYYRVQKIEGYNPNGFSLCKVSLTKVLSGLFNTLPFLLNEDGTYLLQENGTNKFYI